MLSDKPAKMYKGSRVMEGHDVLHLSAGTLQEIENQYNAKFIFNQSSPFASQWTPVVHIPQV